MEKVKNPYRAYKDAIYGQFERIGKALSCAKRLELLDLICQGPRTVEALAQEAGLSMANASKHLQILRSARLVESEKKGIFVVYRLADNAVCEFYRSLRVLGESRLAEIQQITRDFYSGRQGLEPVNRDELLKRVRDGDVTVLDVRPKDEYDAGHISGAVSVPLNELENRLADLPRDREIVAYCRGPYCVLSVEAVEKLRALGFNAVRFEYGVQDWRAARLPVSVGT